MKTFRKALNLVYVIPFVLLWACDEKENVAPTVRVTSPADDAVLVRGDVVPIKALADDEDGSISQISIYIDGEEVGTSEETTFIYNWNTAGLELKEYTLSAFAVDNEGKLDTDNINVLLGAEGGLNPDLVYDTLTDIDGNTYPAIEIGNQVWMAENLKVSHYADGSPITEISDEAEWNAMGPEVQAYCWYDNQNEYKDISGALYTWAAAMYGGLSSDTIPSGVQGVCPDGWHLPSDAEWKELEMSLGMSETDVELYDWRGTDEGGQLKEIGFTNWSIPNTGATNSSGFTAIPGGFRSVKGMFYSIDTDAAYWTSTEFDGSNNAWYRTLNFDMEQVYRQRNSMQLGLSVRCVRDQ